MKPGRELDALIAKKVMGLKVVKNKKGGWSIGPADYYDNYGEMILSNPLPAYSENIADSWAIVEKMKDKGFASVILSGIAENHTIVQFYNPHNHVVKSQGKDAPHAICLAALSIYD